MNNFEIPSKKEDVIRKAEIVDAPKILDLLRINLAKNLSEDEKKGGFLYFEPTSEELERIINDTGIYLSMRGDDLKGYFITMSKELAKDIPFEAEFIKNAEKMSYDGKSIEEHNYAILAQICIAKEYRQGVTFHRLHLMTQSALKNQGFEIGIGEIEDKNDVSLSVHRNYTDAGTYTASSGLLWHVIVVDLRKD